MGGERVLLVEGLKELLLLAAAAGYDFNDDAIV